MDRYTWLAVGLLLFIFGGILLAFFLYLKTAYKQGGWKNVRRAFFIAIVALTAWALERVIQNHQIESFKKALKSWFQ